MIRSSEDKKKKTWTSSAPSWLPESRRKKTSRDEIQTQPTEWGTLKKQPVRMFISYIIITDMERTLSPGITDPSWHFFLTHILWRLYLTDELEECEGIWSGARWELPPPSRSPTIKAHMKFELETVSFILVPLFFICYLHCYYVTKRIQIGLLWVFSYHQGKEEKKREEILRKWDLNGRSWKSLVRGYDVCIWIWIRSHKRHGFIWGDRRYCAH